MRTANKADDVYLQVECSQTWDPEPQKKLRPPACRQQQIGNARGQNCQSNLYNVALRADPDTSQPLQQRIVQKGLPSSDRAIHKAESRLCRKQSSVRLVRHHSMRQACLQQLQNTGNAYKDCVVTNRGVLQIIAAQSQTPLAGQMYRTNLLHLRLPG